MASWIRLTYHRRLFLGLVAYSWFMLVCFAVFQYHRERQLKADELNLRLQAVNDYILRGLAENDSVFVPAGMIPVGFDDMRISIIDEDGRVVYDNTLDHLPESSHLGREEIAAAMAKGRVLRCAGIAKAPATHIFIPPRGGTAILSGRQCLTPCR